jgi:hypothetical protein
MATSSNTAVSRARVIPFDFKQEPGSELYPGVYIGKLLGAGSQAKVYTLVDKDGKPLNRVLKIGHTDIGHTMILNKFAASMMDLQHEWELGVRIMAVLRDETGYLPGYTSTYDSCVSRDEKTGKVVFRGMILEQINGYPVRKRLQDPKFSNIKYVREMLYQLLKALDRGQRMLGFTHADMGLGNVMEHYPEVYPEGKYKSPADIPGFVESGSGSVMPLGPKIEFKIIDYGLVELNDKLAYTAGGTTPIQTIEKLEKEISGPVGHDTEEDLMFGPEDTKASSAMQWKLQKPSSSSTNANDYFLVKPKSTAHMRTKIHKHSTQEQININGAKGPVEKMYRLFWARKGDVFHLLLALGTILTERVWPKEDEKEVRMFAHLVYHVTGVKVTAYFASPEEPKSSQVMGRRDKSAVEIEQLKSFDESDDELSVIDESKDSDIYGKRKSLHNRFWRGCLGRPHMFYRAHAHPFNSGLLAGEALTSPFFGTGIPAAAPAANTSDILAFKK